ncbi:unnamed protein product [Protopolystoma xenopodis]|uniref:Uncharacterized protein n=1 Tax=Protopolystoma xenopodis TaxID=117903 RepID=A0A3S5AWB7_9PLAT|nr:unnamed protein product [Protopolystoma xenopodis]
MGLPRRGCGFVWANKVEYDPVVLGLVTTSRMRFEGVSFELSAFGTGQFRHRFLRGCDGLGLESGWTRQTVGSSETKLRSPKPRMTVLVPSLALSSLDSASLAFSLHRPHSWAGLDDSR